MRKCPDPTIAPSHIIIRTRKAVVVENVDRESNVCRHLNFLLELRQPDTRHKKQKQSPNNTRSRSSKTGNKDQFCRSEFGDHSDYGC